MHFLKWTLLANLVSTGFGDDLPYKTVDEISITFFVCTSNDLDPFLTFTNMTTSTQVFKSEVHKKTLSPVFNPIEVPVSSLSVTG